MVFGFWRRKDLGPVLTASDELMDVHTRLVDGFRGDHRYNGFDNHKGPEVGSLRELAGVIYRHFDVHFYKALDAITRYEEGNPGPFTSILRQNEVTVVDLGAGIGTFSTALVDFLHQKRGDASIRRLNVVLVEPNAMWHRYSRWLFGEMKGYIGFDVRLEIVSARFPEADCLAQTIKLLENMSREFLIIGMSNLLSWLKNTYQEQASFLLALIQISSPLYGLLLSIEPKDKVFRKMFRKLSSKMKSLYSILAQQNEACSCTGPKAIRVYYRHFPKSYYGERGYQVYHNWYLSGFAVFKSGLAALGNLDNLRTAYFKARMALRREFPCDEVAIKLFESHLDLELERCAQTLKNGYKFCPNPLHYKSPKNEKEYRIRIMDNVHDSLVATAFLDLYGRRLDKDFLDVSCGNRINPERHSEYIYVHFWYAWYHRFILPLLRNAPNNYRYYCHLDIASFYPNVNQTLLLKKLLNLLPGQDTGLKNLLVSLILRNYRDHKPKHGLPQGPVTSGFLANLYLHEVDEAMQTFSTLFYRRYVDDFYLLGETKEHLRQCIVVLGAYLGRLGLRLKEEKSEFGARSELYSRYCDPRLDRLDRRLRNTLRRLYAAVAENREYLHIWQNMPQEFFVWYANCLRELGLMVSPQWLHRKICYQRHKRLSALRQLGNHLFGKRVTLPPLGGNLSDPRHWAEVFRKRNPAFCRSLELIRHEVKIGLEKLYKEYYPRFEELPLAEQGRVKSHLRFYTYRASVLIVPEITGILEKLAWQPWLCSIAVLRTYPEVLRKLVANFRGLSPYMRSAALWAMGEARCGDFADFLGQVILDRSSPLLVKLMASQAMLRIGSVSRLGRVALENEMKRALNREEYIYLKNLILLWGAHGEKPEDSQVVQEIREKSAQLRDHDRWLIESALESMSEGLNIMSALDVMPDWIEPEEYPEWEDVPEIVPLS